MLFQPIEIRDTTSGVQLIGFDELMRNQHYLTSSDITSICVSIILAAVVTTIVISFARAAKREHVKELLDAQHEHEQVMKYGRTADQRCEVCGRAWDVAAVKP